MLTDSQFSHETEFPNHGHEDDHESDHEYETEGLNRDGDGYDPESDHEHEHGFSGVAK